LQAGAGRVEDADNRQRTDEAPMELTLAINRYDRHVPFFNDTVRPP